LGLLIVLLGGAIEVSLGPDGVARLADLGITSVALLKDEDAWAFVLEGWAFDPVRSGSEAKAIVSGGKGVARTLHQVMDMAISREVTQPDPPSEMWTAATAAGSAARLPFEPGVGRGRSEP
jgi:hypothetical protein